MQAAHQDKTLSCGGTPLIPLLLETLATDGAIRPLAVPVVTHLAFALAETPQDITGMRVGSWISILALHGRARGLHVLALYFGPALAGHVRVPLFTSILRITKKRPPATHIVILCGDHTRTTCVYPLCLSGRGLHSK